LPEFEWYCSSPDRGDSVPDGFRYTSDQNEQWLSVEDLRRLAGL